MSSPLSWWIYLLFILFLASDHKIHNKQCNANNSCYEDSFNSFWVQWQKYCNVLMISTEIWSGHLHHQMWWWRISSQVNWITGLQHWNMWESFLEFTKDVKKKRYSIVSCITSLPRSKAALCSFQSKLSGTLLQPHFCKKVTRQM